MESITLVSGYEMPLLGLGTWDLRGNTCKNIVKKALDLGYTHIDTAWMYENQRMIGGALQEINANREELFITSKIWHTHLKYNDVLAQFEESLDQLQMDYVDLLLVHWPNESVPMEETLKAFNEIHAAGQARSIGISNFSMNQVDRALAISQAPICVNQVEYHIRHNQDALLQHCKDKQVVVTAHRPLGVGRIIGDPLLKEIGAQHSKTPALVALRWLVQKGIVVIPKTSSEAHLRENMDVFDWTLTSDDMGRLDAISG